MSTYTLDTSTSRANPTPAPMRRLTAPKLKARKGGDPIVAATRDDAIGAVRTGDEVCSGRPEDRRPCRGGSDGRQRREEQDDRQPDAHTWTVATIGSVADA